MSDDDEPRRRRGGGRWLMVLGWVAAALLAGNLVWGKLNAEGGRPRGFVSEGIVRAVAFWVPLAVVGAAGVLGIRWMLAAHERREKSSLVWFRHAFTFSLVGAALLLVAAFDRTHFPREWFVPWAAAILAVQTSLFAYAAFREYRRAVGHGGRRGEDE